MNLLLLIISFLFSGLTLIPFQALIKMGLARYEVIYMLGIGGGALLANLISYAIRRHGMRWIDITIGVIMGAACAVTLLTLLQALEHMNGIVAFPIRSCGNIALTALISYAVWREKITPRQLAGIFCAILSIYLLI